MMPKINPLPPIIEEEKKVNEKRGVTLKIDYTNNRLDLENGRPKRLTGYEALKERIRKIIYTQKDRFLIYKTGNENYENYGNPILRYIGQNLPTDFLEAESDWWVKELFKNEDEILEIRDITSYMYGDSLQVEYKLKTIYGEKEDIINV
ncbi:MAG: DUF2634 domain-containing protein [Cetobacterium sp.]